MWTSRLTARGLPRALLRGTGAGEKQAWKRKTAKAQKQLEKRAESQPSGAPWNDGGSSFSTKERLVVRPKNMQKVTIFSKKTHFLQFLGAVLRKLCWADRDTKLIVKGILMFWQARLLLEQIAP